MPQKDHEEPIIGADRNAAYSTPTESRASSTQRGSRRPSLWPLYGLLLLLVAAVVAMGIQYYQDRQQWSEKMSTLTDRAQEGAANRQKMSTNLEHILDGIRSEQQTQRTQLETLQQRLEQQAGDDQDTRLNQLEKADVLRQQTLVSLQQSMDSLDAVIEGLESTYDARFNDVENTDARLENRLQSVEDSRQHLESLAASVADHEKALASIKTRVDELTVQAERIQQNQTSLHAAQESLQDLLNP